MRIVEFVIGLGLLIFIHEFGHYLFARLFKIEVEEFGFGFPPRMLKLFTFQGTEFTLNWIPFGAFVRPKGENDPDQKGGLADAAAWKRLLVFLGGPLMNLGMAVLIFALVFSITGIPDRSKVLIQDVSANSPAQTAGIAAGDRVVSINGEAITSVEKLASLVTANLGKEMEIVLEKDGSQRAVNATPRANPPQGEGALGILMGYSIQKANYISSIPFGFEAVGMQIDALVSLPGKLIRGEVQGQDARVIGVVGMYSIFDNTRAEDQTDQASGGGMPISTLALFGTISAALGITNLLPLPALDGGRILFLIPELLMGKKVPQQYENLVHSIGFILLLILMVVITIQDIINPIQLK